MPSSDFSEIKIVNDDADRKEIIRGIIKSNNQEDAFHLLDIGEVITRNKLWLRKMPRVTPYFGKIKIFLTFSIRDFLIILKLKTLEKQCFTLFFLSKLI